MWDLLRSKAFRPVAITLLVTTLALITLFTLQWLVLDRFESATTQVLTAASEGMAARLSNSVQRDLKAPAFNLLEQIEHADVYSLRLARIAEKVRTRQHDFSFISHFFVWSRRPNSVYTSEEPLPDAALFLSLEDRQSAGSVKPAPEFRRDAQDSRSIVADAIELARSRRNFGLTLQSAGGRERYVVYHFLYDKPERTQLDAFLGFTVDIGKLTEHYFPEIIAKTRMRTPALAGFPEFTVAVIDDQEQEVYRSGVPPLGQYPGRSQFPLLFFDIDLLESLSPFRPEVRYWSIRTGYEGTSIADIVRLQTRYQKLLWLVVVVIGTAGLTLSLRGAIHEIRLAQMKSAFVARVSHDLKTPLAKIQLFAETLQSGRVRTPERCQEYYDIISKQARKLGELITRILDFASLEAVVQEEPVEEIELRQLVQTCLSSVGEELSCDRFRVETVFPDEEMVTRGSVESLRELVDNLISNAIKYSGQEKFLRIELKASDHLGVIQVIDHGIGITRHEQRNIFRRFYRVDGAAEAARGSGLGLAIVQQIAQAHGGSVSVESSPGRGSVFTVALPLVQQAAEISV